MLITIPCSRTRQSRAADAGVRINLMEKILKGKFVIALSAVFFIGFAYYAFSSTDKINSSATVLGPFMRSFTVGVWLLAAIVLNRKNWHRYSTVNISIGLFLPLVVLMLFGYEFDYSFSVFSYCFVSAISAVAILNIGKVIVVWLVSFIGQIVVDLCLGISGLYGPVSFS